MTVRMIAAVAAGIAGAAVGAVPGPFTAEELKEGAFEAACDRRTAEWDAWQKAYKPDYSDSSAMLQPPADHRFAKPFAVVKGGKPAAEIVFNPVNNGEPCLETAANELQKYVKAITGVELPIRSGWGYLTRKTGKNKIVIGKNQIPSKGSYPSNPKFEAALAKLSGRDGYAIMTDTNYPDCVFIFGQRDKGALNGVYAFLEGNTDIIWARPDETIGTVFTETPGELEAVWGEDVVSSPDTKGRGWNGYVDLEWMSHNRCNIFNCGGGGEISWMNPKKTRYGVLYTRHLGGHNIFHFLRNAPTNVGYRATLEDGVTPMGRPGLLTNPCFASDKLVELVASNVLCVARWMPDNTDKIYINTQDTWNQCMCPLCRAPITCDDGSVVKLGDENFRSTQFWRFMNRVIARVHEEMPGVKIVSLAYFPSVPVPGVAVDPSIHPEFAPYVRANDKRPLTAPENRKWLKLLLGWSKVSREIETYDYYGLGLGFPRPLAEVRAWDFAYTDPYVVGWTSEYTAYGDTEKKNKNIWDVSAIEFWTMSRLYWDPQQDVERLRKYFIRRAFREAAPEIERIYGTIREEWFRNPRYSTLGDNPTELAKLFVVKTGHADEFAALFAKALARTDLHPKARAMTEAFRDRFMPHVEKAKNMKNPSMQWPIVPVTGAVDWDSAVWEKGAEIDGFQKLYQKTRDVASFHPTNVRVFHDGRTLYIRARMEDPEIDKVLVPQIPGGRKEYIPESDHLELFFTDATDESKYYMFSLSPDGLWSDLLGSDGAWNCEWRRRARRTAKGWEAIFEIPLLSIGAADGNHNDLKFLILREVNPHGSFGREYSSWGGGVMHQTFTFGDVKIVR